MTLDIYPGSWLQGFKNTLRFLEAKAAQAESEDRLGAAAMYHARIMEMVYGAKPS